MTFPIFRIGVRASMFSTISLNIVCYQKQIMEQKVGFEPTYLFSLTSPVCLMLITYLQGSWCHIIDLLLHIKIAVVGEGFEPPQRRICYYSSVYKLRSCIVTYSGIYTIKITYRFSLVRYLSGSLLRELRLPFRHTTIKLQIKHCSTAI